MKDNEDIGLAVRLARVAMRRTQWQVAQKLGVHPAIINQVEHGKTIRILGLAQSILQELRAGAPPPYPPLVTMVLDEAERIIRDETDATQIRREDQRQVGPEDH